MAPVEPCLSSAGPGVSVLLSSSLVGWRVIDVSEVQVAWSTEPDSGIPRLFWNPRTPAVVTVS